VEAGPPRRCRLDAVKSEIAEIERIDEGVDHANGVLLVDPVVEARRQERRLPTIYPFNEPLHGHPPRIIRGIIECPLFSHSQGHFRTFLSRFESSRTGEGGGLDQPRFRIGSVVAFHVAA
jgi:hypothetical protein